MKKLIFIAVFFMSFQFLFSMDVETRYYNPQQTKLQVQEKLKFLTTMYTENEYYSAITKKISADDYTVKYDHTSNGATTSVEVRYQFFQDRVTISLLRSIHTKADRSTLILTSDSSEPKIRTAYEAMRGIFIDLYFKELQIFDNKQPLIKK